jgi:alpha-tubulin suppressor-like RCC1 family protein
MAPLGCFHALGRCPARDLARRAALFGAGLGVCVATVTSTAFTRSSDVIDAWGVDSHGQLGTGNTVDASRPERVTLADGVRPVAISAGGFDSLAIGSNRMLFAWGDNADGQLGDGTTIDRLRPEQIMLAAGVWPRVISAGYDANLAIGSNGDLYAWGDNTYGQLGDGTTIDRSRPEQIMLAAGVWPRVISAGYDANLAIGSNGDLYAWGLALFGQLGDGGRTDRLRPEHITLALRAIPAAISAGYFASLAVDSQGRLYAWGDNCCGQVGDGTNVNRLRPEPITMAFGVRAAAISEGVESLAIGSDHKLYAWGPDPFQPPGDGTQVSHSLPENVVLGHGAAPVALSAGGGDLVMGSNGKLYAWAWNALGLPGDPTAAPSQAPEIIELNADTLSAGGEHSLAISDSVVAETSSSLFLLPLVAAASLAALYVTRRSRRTRSSPPTVDEPPELSPYL